MFHIHRDHDDHSVYAERLGRFRRRIPGHDRKSGIPDEGPRSVRCVVLSAEAGRGESVPVWQTVFTRWNSGWRGRPAVFLATFAFVAAIVARFVNYFSAMHRFAAS